MKADKRVIAGIWVFAVVVYAFVIVLHELPGTAIPPAFAAYQPPLHAVLNGLCFILLLGAFVAIRKGNVTMHKKLNTSAMMLSVCFLLSYVVYHYLAGDTSYGGAYKGMYLFILLTHIALAGISLPFILLAWYRGYIGDVAGHRRLVRFVFPVWAYVALTGVMVYLFLAPYYAL
jgi:putative membrane protein